MLETSRYVSDVLTDLVYEQTAEDFSCMSAYRSHVQIIFNHSAMFATIFAVYWPRAVTDFEHIYFYGKWDGLLRDLTFERRLQHSRDQAELLFFGLHNVGIFPVSIAHRLLLYMLVLAWWMETDESAGIYQILTSWL